MHESKSLESYNIQDLSKIYLIPTETVSELTSKNAIKSYQTHEKCSKCKNKPSWICECSKIYLCNAHRLDHLMIPIAHNIQLFKTFLQPEFSSEVRKSIATKIEFINSFYNKIQQDTDLLISKISKSCIDTLKSLEQSKNSYLQLLQFTERKVLVSEIEELEECLLNDLL